MTKIVAKKLSIAGQARAITNDAIKHIQLATTEEESRAVALKAWRSLKELVPNKNSFRRTSKQFRDKLKSAFSDKGYDFVLTQHVEQQTVEQPQLTLTLGSMKLEHLELDHETAERVNAALAHSGMALSDFLKQACSVYSRMVMSRASQVNDDLSAIPTQELLDSVTYKTHPGRAVELLKRSVKAIKLHNAAATEIAHKWGITQSLLVELTGSKPSTLKELMKQFASDIDGYNAQLKADYDLDETKFRYLNRKDKSIQKPDLVVLVPDGIDG